MVKNNVYNVAGIPCCKEFVQVYDASLAQNLTWTLTVAEGVLATCWLQLDYFHPTMDIDTISDLAFPYD